MANNENLLQRVAVAQLGKGSMCIPSASREVVSYELVSFFEEDLIIVIQRTDYEATGYATAFVGFGLATDFMVL